MASTLVRAMTFGAASSSSSSSRDRSASRDQHERGDGSSRSRSSSRTGFAAKTLGAIDIGGGGGGGLGKKDDESLGLSRTSSRLLSTSGSSPPPAGILINSVSPTLNGMLVPSPVYGQASSSSASTSNLDLSSSTSTTPGAARPALTRTLSDGSSSGSQAGPLTPSSATFSGPLPSSSSTLPATPTTTTTTVGGMPQPQPRPSKIRFAPLPEIRPRRYSTGRNVWIVDEDGDGEDGQPRRTRLVRVGSDLEDGGAGGADDFALDDDDDDDDDDVGGSGGGGPGRGLMGGKFGSWSETFGGGMWGLSPSTSRRSQDDDARSTTSSLGGGGGDDVRSPASVGSAGSASSSKKLLKAFGLKPKSSNKPKNLVADDDSLTRVSSVESQASRRLSSSASTSEGPPAPARPRTSTGVPMRRYASWEVGAEASSAQNGSAPSSSAANGAAVAAGSGPVYYASPARSARRRANYPPVAQRSRRPASSTREAAGSRARGVQVDEPAFEEWGVGGVGSRSKRTSFSGSGREDEEDDDGSGMAWLRKRRLQREREERERRERELAGDGAGTVEAAKGQQLEENAAPAQEDDHELPAPEGFPAYLDGVRRRSGPGQVPSRSATIESTASSASTIRPSTPVALASPSLVNNKPSGLSATRPILSVDVGDTTREGSSSTASPSASGSDETPITSPVSAGAENEAEESASDDEDDDDLCAEELAREEALAEAAKRSARSMGAERYHTADHHDELRVLEDRAA